MKFIFAELKTPFILRNQVSVWSIQISSNGVSLLPKCCWRWQRRALPRSAYMSRQARRSTGQPFSWVTQVETPQLQTFSLGTFVSAAKLQGRSTSMSFSSEYVKDSCHLPPAQAHAGYRNTCFSFATATPGELLKYSVHASLDCGR